MTWRYVEIGSDDQPRLVTMTEEQIIAEYYAHWTAQMLLVGKQDQVSEQNCIEDWAVVHWAWQLAP